jgi:signal transduction histidine kinase
VAKHAQASHVDVAVVVDDTSASVTVTDDGVGPGADKRSASAGAGHGLGNLVTRAARHGGTSELRPGDGQGTILE